MRQLIREPLIHFLLMGAGLFIFFNLVSNNQASDDRRIIVTDAIINIIEQRYQNTWRRPPTADELQGLVDSYLRDEILYREGIAMALDKNDAVVRRRILQKISVLTEEVISQETPTDEQLNDYLQANSERYEQPAIIAFDQVFFDPVRHGEKLDSRLAIALTALQAGAAHNAIGDSSLLQESFTGINADRLNRDFGKTFANALLVLTVGEWQGPIRSGYGQHLVRVNANTAARASSLNEVRMAVTRDWENNRRIKATETYIEALSQSYDISYETSVTAKAQQ